MLKTCVRLECQILYSSARNGVYCPKCHEQEESAFRTIRDYLVAAPHSSVIEIFRDTGIPLDIVEKLVKSGRLNYAHVSRCTRCLKALGIHTSDTSLCETCLTGIRNEFSSQLTRQQPRANGDRVVLLNEARLSHRKGF